MRESTGAEVVTGVLVVSESLLCSVLQPVSSNASSGSRESLKSRFMIPSFKVGKSDGR
jgi:hypothetical protein